MAQPCAVPFDSYCLDGNILTVRPCGSGHINRTWRVVTDRDVHYLFQRVNTDVFPDIDGLMQNISRVTEHICKKMEQSGGDSVRGTLHIVPAADGALYVRTEDGCFRCYQYIRKPLPCSSPGLPRICAVQVGRSASSRSAFPTSRQIPLCR